MRNRRQSAVGFTLVELLVTISIIGIMTALTMGVAHSARQMSAEAATKATITKLNAIIMKRYEGYRNRRVPISTVGKTPPQAAQMRLDAIRDLMRMEMPDAATDVTQSPISFSWGSVPEPALHKLYAASPPTADHDGAQCLYQIVSQANPEAMQQFSQSEVGIVDGKPCFIDGWGNPIMWLRWAPGYSNCPQLGLSGPSTIQSGNPTTAVVPIDANTGAAGSTPLILPDGSISTTQKVMVADHDPFDTRQVDGFAFRLVPLIYSAGPDGVYGLGINTGAFNGNPYAAMSLGQPLTTGGYQDNITNHSIEMR